MSSVRASISPQGTRIRVAFPYSPDDVQAVKGIPGRKFNSDARAWDIPLDLESARALRGVFGDRLELGRDLADWGRREIRRERNLGQMATASDAELQHVSDEFAGWMDPHQRADVAFLAERDAINGNEPGLGKTEEMIGAVIEANLLHRPILITAPLTTLHDPWNRLIHRWLPDATVLTGFSVAERKRALARATEMAEAGESFWLVLNPEFVRYGSDGAPKYPEIFSIEWGAVIVDEFRNAGLSNRKTLSHKGFSSLRRERMWMLSGTPMGGDPRNLWGALNLIAPQTFTSLWAWMERWIASEPNVHAQSGKSFLPEIQPGKEDEFYAHLQPYLVRRTRAEVRTNAAPREHEVWCEMLPKQRKQYVSFCLDAETRTEGGLLQAEGVLAEATRMRQIADSVVDLVDGNVTMTGESGKIDRLIDALAERGITRGNPDGEEKVVIASQWNQMIDAIERRLDKLSIPTLRITGKEDANQRAEAQEAFREDDSYRVMLINTKAGGVGIDLDRADSVHIMDETWNPDDQLQVSFRIDRRGRTRTAPMDIYTYRSEHTVDELMANINHTKRLTNQEILELCRAAFRQAHDASRKAGR